jgi:UDP-glucuronate 4-epimerase
MHCAERLARSGDEVAGLDNLNSYYSVELKQARLARLSGLARVERLDLD